MSHATDDARQKRHQGKGNAKPMEDQFVRDLDEADADAPPSKSNKRKTQNQQLQEMGGGGRPSSDDEERVSPAARRHKPPARSGGGDGDDDGSGGDSDSGSDDDLSALGSLASNVSHGPKHASTRRAMEDYLIQDLLERNPQQPLKKLLHHAHIKKQTDFLYGTHSEKELPAALQDQASAAGFFGVLHKTALKARLSREAEALSALMTRAFQRASAPGKRWHPVGVYVTYLLAAYAQSLDPADLQWEAETFTDIEAFHPPPTSAAPYRQQPRQTNQLRNPPRGGPAMPHHLRKGGFIGNSRTPSPIGGVFCSSCGLHGWGKPHFCPRCRGDDRAIWLHAHQMLSTEGVNIPSNTAQPPIIQQPPISLEVSGLATPIEFTVQSRPLAPEEAAQLPTLDQSNSSWARISAHLPRVWTARSIRAPLLADIKDRLREAGQPQEEPHEEPAEPTRHHARETLAMLRQYLQALETSEFGHLYRRDLHGPQAPSPLKPEGFWELHRESCTACAARGPWQHYRQYNADNPCWISDVLAIIYHGWIPVFDKVPTKFRKKNAKSLNLAPRAIRQEHDRSVAAGAVREDHSDYISPLINAVRQHEVDEQVARMTRHGIVVPQECTTDLDQLNTLIDDHKDTVPFLSNVKCRLCIDLSRVINQHMAPWSFSYHSVQDALNMLQPACFLAKVDLTRMYHQIPLHRGIQHFFAYRLLNRTWVCQCAPFGGTSTPAFANLLAGITAIMLVAKYIASVWITDDSLYSETSFERCKATLQQVIAVMERLGWLINMDKLEGPAQLLTFLGILIDTVKQTLGIPQARLVTLLAKLTDLLAARRLTVRDIRSIAGRLQWVAAVFPHGRPYIASLYSHTTGDNADPVHLSPLAREDMQWWASHLTTLIDQAQQDATAAAWTSYSFDPIPRPIRIFSDASGDMSLGFGLIYDNQLIQGTWRQPLHKSSSYLEYLPILHLLQQHGPSLQGALLICHTDNAANALAFNRGSTLAPSCRQVFRQLSTLAVLIILFRYLPKGESHF
jgi:hypothetical protein